MAIIRQTPLLALMLSGLLIGNVAFATYTVRHHNQSTGSNNGMSNASEYPLLSRRIFAENPNDPIVNFVALRKSINTKLGTVSAQKSFYFEYLPSGTTIKVGSDNELVAASLIKLPLAMNLYRAAELGKINLDKTVTVQPSDVDNAYGDLWKKGAGYRLTLRDATKLMLEASDNTATHVVFDAMKGVLNDDEQSLSQLDVEQNLKDGQAVIDSQSYSSVLRSLYLSSYLSKENSQEILSYLSKSDETRRLTNLLPKNIVVAHKNGVYNASWSESDCGIVYVPKRPYLLCIMVGLPEDQANTLIAELSKQVYDYVVSQP